MAIVDLEKAFESKLEQTISNTMNTKLKYGERIITVNTNMNQMAAIKIYGYEKEFVIKKRVTLECLLSLPHFN